MIDTYVKEGKYSQGMMYDWTSWFQHDFFFSMQLIIGNCGFTKIFLFLLWSRNVVGEDSEIMEKF